MAADPADPTDPADPADPALADTPGVPWKQFFDEAKDRLGAAGFENPSLDARRIVEEAAGFEPAEFAIRLADPATQRGVVRFDRMLPRRLAGEPLQYVVGRWGFRTLDLMVDPRALIPRPETEVVVGVGLDELERQAAAVPGESLRAVDLGTGSGAIGLSLLAERPDTQVICTDASASALALARANLSGLGRAGVRGIMCEGEWFAALDPAEHGPFHLVISNPPYVRSDASLPPVVQDWEPHRALFAGSDGMDDARIIIEQSFDWIVPGGALVLELDPGQMSAATELANAAGYTEARVVADLVDRDRVFVVRKPA